MELNELLKMISSIPERKSKCRGNLRLKVLLKTTYDYARRSWIDGQFGKPQKLQTLLKNSMFNHSPTLSSGHSSLSSETEATITPEEKSTVKYNHLPEHLIDTSENGVCDDVLRSDLSLEEDEMDESEDSLKRTEETKENRPELHRVMKKLLKNCNMLIEISALNRSNIPDYHLNLRKLKRIIHLSRIARVHLERDYENQEFGQQRINRKALKLIRYLLKQCKTLLKVNYNSRVDHHKLKKIIKKLKKFESCAGKIVAHDKFCEKPKDHFDSSKPMEVLNEKEIFNESQFSYFGNDQNDSNSNCFLKESPKLNFIHSSDLTGTNCQQSGTKPIFPKRNWGKYFRDRSDKYKQMFIHIRFHRQLHHNLSDVV